MLINVGSDVADLSLAIRNATIIDGSGQPAFLGDVELAGDEIVNVGRVSGTAATEIDADGDVLSAGFIDTHTHYDPQLCWDGLATPSPEHGVTTVVIGNCSLSLAPASANTRRKIVKLFGVVEDIGEATFDAGVPFNWDSFDTYLSRMNGTIGPNVGALVGHSALRLFVMGESAQERSATDAELGEMCALLEGAMSAGALGLSYSYAHIDELGNPLPCSFADLREKRALCRAMTKSGRGVVQLVPKLGAGETVLDMFDECGALSLETGARFSVAPIIHTPAQGDLWLRMLVRLEAWRERGADLFCQTQVRPRDLAFRLSRGSLALSKGATWSKLLNDCSVSDRINAFRDPATRTKLDEELDQLQRFVTFIVLRKTEAQINQAYIGQKIVEIAANEGRRVVDVLLDIALADDLESEFEMAGFAHADPQIVSLLLSHPGICIGAGDAGAHVGQFAGAGDTSYFLERFVRELRVFSLEQAIQRLTSDPVSRWQIANRGLIQPGKHADLVLFDPKTIARGVESYVTDLPCGGGRYMRHPTGIKKVIVNGELLLDEGGYTRARPGRIV